MSPASAPAGVRFEHRTDDGAVLGIGTPAPRLSWYLPDAPDGFRQHAYQVEISRSAGPVELTTVTSAEQILVPWPGAYTRFRDVDLERDYERVYELFPLLFERRK